MTEAPLLLPCPFCGGKAYLANVEMVGCSYVVCTDCRIQGDDMSKERAVATWNSRPAHEAAVAAARKEGMPIASSLAAAISLLENAGKSAKKAAPSDKMFDQMLNDYRKALDDWRKAYKDASK